jgi:hypothetical protein
VPEEAADALRRPFLDATDLGFGLNDRLELMRILAMPETQPRNAAH